MLGSTAFDGRSKFDRNDQTQFYHNLEKEKKRTNLKRVNSKL